MINNPENTVVTVRPHHLLCLFCALEKPAEVPEGGFVAELAQTIRRDPGLPLALCCRSDDSFAYQSPAEGGADALDACFTQKQDMEILFRMNLPLGTVMPARIAVAMARKAVTSVSGICGYGEATAPAWCGCPLAGSGVYWQVRDTGMDRIFPPRERDAMDRDKAASLDAMLKADVIRTRPHILLCAIERLVPETSVWWDPCPCGGYEKGRRELMNKGDSR